MRLFAWLWVPLAVSGCAASGEEDFRRQLARQDAQQEAERQRHRADVQRELRELVARREAERSAARSKREDLVASAEPSPPRDPEVDWLKDAEARCSFALNYKSCTVEPPSAAASTECRSRCESAINLTVTKLANAAIDNCLQGYAAATPPLPPGPECDLTLPADADPKGTGVGIPDDLRAKVRAACTAECRLRGAKLLASAKERDKAAQQGPALVLAYKRCMLAVDGTTQAIRYKLHDSGLYQDLMQKTDTRCRSTHRCDWLEEHSEEFACSYGD